MEQVIPFSKDITFKTKIGELTSICLDNDLSLKEGNLISGNFYIKGTYKMLRTSEIEEDYNYKVPCDIAISEEYETNGATFDIDDFTYEIVNDEILRVNISVKICNLERKMEEVLVRKIEEDVKDVEDVDIKDEEVVVNDESDKQIKIELESVEENKHPSVNVVTLEDERDSLTSFTDFGKDVLNCDETYVVYSVYVVREDDSLNKILEKYDVSAADLSDYNDITTLEAGTKLIIPNCRKEC